MYVERYVIGNQLLSLQPFIAPPDLQHLNSQNFQQASWLCHNLDLLPGAPSFQIQWDSGRPMKMRSGRSLKQGKHLPGLMKRAGVLPVNVNKIIHDWQFLSHQSELSFYSIKGLSPDNNAHKRSKPRSRLTVRNSKSNIFSKTPIAVSSLVLVDLSSYLRQTNRQTNMEPSGQRRRDRAALHSKCHRIWVLWISRWRRI